MKKRILIALALFAGATAFAQQKKPKQPPPPPPPVADVKEVPPPPPPPRPIRPQSKTKAGLPKGYREFLKRNPFVKGIGWSTDKIHIRLKSGKEDVYDLNSEEDIKRLKNKYGELPPPPPPPPVIEIKGS